MPYFGPYFGVSGGGATVEVPDGPSTAPTRLATVYAADEDVALAAGDDWAALAARHLKLAEGPDGVFAANRPWRLDSATVDFTAQGVLPRHVLLLSRPTSRYGRIAGGEAFAVQGVAGGAVELRRLGQDPGRGSPPAPAAGLAEVEFACLTMGPAIDEASYAANRLCGIDPADPGRTPADLADLRELRRFVVLTVLRGAYAGAPKSEGSDFATKLGLVSAELAEVAARLRVRWGPDGKSEPPSGPFTARLRR